jgi:hypothetical protein
MRSPHRLLAILALCPMLTLSLGAAAQDATPVTTTFPVVPAPSECRVAPRTLDNMLGILAQATPPAVASRPSSFVVPVGKPADATVSLAVIAVVREYIACLSAADYPRTFGLFTDDYARRLAEEPTPLTEADIRALFSADPAANAPTRPLAILAVADIVNLDDGRVGAFAVIVNTYKSPARAETAYLYFARKDGRWLLDDDTDFSPD